MARRRTAVVAAVLATVTATIGPACAQQASSGITPALRLQQLDLQPPPANTDMQAVSRPLDPRSQNPDCAPAWPCQLRLFGVIEKYGGLGLKAPVLTW